MKIWRFAVPALILTVGLIVNTTTSRATIATAKKEGGKSCVTCHVKTGSKDLNNTGKCYKDKKDLKACATEKK